MGNATINEILELASPYAVYLWAAGLGWTFYKSSVFLIPLFAQTQRDDLALWLMGGSKDSYARSFNALFEGVFGEKHWSPKCIFWSCVFSISSVVLFYLLLGPFLGVFEARAGGSLDFWYVMAVGALVNLIPDYISLWETRFVLRLFQSLKSTLFQFVVLLFDFFLSALIILAALFLFLWATGERTNLIDQITILSPFSVFFLSTFSTSLWALVYFLSTLIMKLFADTWITSKLDFVGQPHKIIGVVGGLIVFFASFGSPYLATGLAKAADRVVCAVSPDDSCWLVMRNSENVAAIESLIAATCTGGSALTVARPACVAPEMNSTAYDVAERLCSSGLVRGCLYQGFLSSEATERQRLYGWACEQGDGEACRYLGYLFADGFEGVETNTEAASSAYERGCELEDWLSCSNFGALHEPVGEKAAALFERACVGGSVHGCMNLAVYLGNTQPQKALDLLSTACDDGEAEACYRAALQSFAIDQSNSNIEVAHALFVKACEGGHPESCFNAGQSFWTGDGAGVDKPKAVDYFERACLRGNVEACSQFGLVLLSGEHVEPDVVRGYSLLSYACDQGDMLGCFNLGFELLAYDRIIAPPQQAAELFEKACDGGIAGACSNLGNMLMKGIGLEVDEERGARLYKRACDLKESPYGGMDGCLNYALVLYAGQGIEANPTLARKHFGDACDSGLRDACNLIIEIWGE